MTTAEPPTITLPPLHRAQQAIAKDHHRFKVVCCGRRWGKTMLGITLCLRSALKGGRVWWVAPSYKQALEGWSYLQRLIVQMPSSRARTQVSDLIVTFAGGGSVQVRTGDNPDNLRGAGLDGVVLDEAATMKREAWDLVLRPALADKQGWALFIGTPQHYNWFYDLWEMGQNPANEDWASWQHPTWDNPFIPESEIDAAQRDMLPEDFDQEFGASFTAIGGAVFRLLSANRPFYLRPMPQGLVFQRSGVGMDWGTTKQHQANVTGAGRLSDGAVWMRSSWLSDSGSSDLWRQEAERCKRDQGATFARVDRSQSSELDRLKALGFQAESGLANVEARNGNVQSLVIKKAIFWDSNDPGARVSFEHYCAYHRDRDGVIVEEEDDDVDGGGYVVSELVQAYEPYHVPQATSLEYVTRDQFRGRSEYEQIQHRQAQRQREAVRGSNYMKAPTRGGI